MARTDRIFLFVDANPSWVRSLASGLRFQSPERESVLEYEVYGISYVLRRSLMNLGQAGCSRLDNRRQILIPGWNTLPKVSTSIVFHRLRRVIAAIDIPVIVVYTTPWYAEVARRMQDHFQVYYAYDDYRNYLGWNKAKIDDLECTMLSNCNMAFGVSKLLVSDMTKRSLRPVHYSPNAADSHFINYSTSESIEKPEDIAALDGVIVGCVGAINYEVYDWELIEALSDEFLDSSFVFIGPRSEGTQAQKARVDALFAKSNVHWIGSKHHTEIPNYLNAFDVCLCPLAVNDFNQRRSLLRFYDYLSTDKPILSTKIADAYEHRNHLQIANDVEDAKKLLAEIILDGSVSNLDERRRHIESNTWERRAARFKAVIEDQLEAESEKP